MRWNADPDRDLTGPPSRRRVVLGLSGLVAAVVYRPARAVAHLCRMAVDADEGPFYPVVPIPETNDLALVPGNPSQAQGQLVYLTGVVTAGPDCKGLAGATVEIWQCDAGGQYRHPRAPLTKEFDPSFRYFGRTGTGADGFYRFRTIRPAAYRVFGIERAPHIHIRVKHKDHQTLMVVALEPAPARAEVLRIKPEPEALCLRYDLGLTS